MTAPIRDAQTVIRAFSEDHLVRLTGLTKRQLRAWDREGFFVPHYAYEDRRAAYSRVYSFRDVVGLRTIAVLRNRYRVPLRVLRQTARELEQRGFEHWADTKLYVVNRQVHFRRPDTGEIEGLDDGQLAMLPVIDVMNDISDRVQRLNERSEDQIGHIEQHRYVARNAWVVAGTRIPSASIRRFHEAGYSIQDIMREYPSLTREDVKAALLHESGLAESA